MTKPAGNKKGKAQPLVRSAKQAAAAKKAAEAKEADDLRQVDKAAAQQLAQIVNLRIGGHSYASIGAAIGKSADEVEQMVTNSAGAYVRTQPALRVFVRNFISEKYSGMLDATYPQAVDTTRPDQLDYVSSVQKTLKDMAALHGANAPLQSEVTVEASDETVEALVASLAKTRGLSYDYDVFDADDVDEVMDDIHEADVLELEASTAAVEESTDDDEL